MAGEWPDRKAGEQRRGGRQGYLHPNDLDDIMTQEKEHLIRNQETQSH